MRAIPGAILVLAGATLVSASIIAFELRDQHRPSGLEQIFNRGGPGIYALVPGVIIGLIGCILYLVGFIWDLVDRKR